MLLNVSKIFYNKHIHGDLFMLQKLYLQNVVSCAIAFVHDLPRCETTRSIILIAIGVVRNLYQAPSTTVLPLVYFLMILHCDMAEIASTKYCLARKKSWSRVGKRM